MISAGVFKEDTNTYTNGNNVTDNPISNTAYRAIMPKEIPNGTMRVVLGDILVLPVCFENPKLYHREGENNKKQHK